MRKKEKKYRIETSEEIPLVGGKREWNVYDVNNSILHHSKDDGKHPSIVLVEYNGKVLVAELNHTSGPMKKKIKNPNSNDTQKDSYMKRRTIVSKDKEMIDPITLKDLHNKRNDRIFSAEEKKEILDSLNNKKINKFNMKVLLTLKTKEKKPKNRL